MELSANYMIHTMPKRLWYVNEYLIPSMIEQGIDEHNILIHCDDGGGCLESCMQAFGKVEEPGGTWHLQDDIIISRDFKKQTEQHDIGIVCGFCCMYDNELAVGVVPVKEMWWSFPCIRIPNHIALECSRWYYRYMKNNAIYKHMTKDGVNDDWIFRHYLWDHYSWMEATNLIPNLVDHIDYLIGGTVNSNKRIRQIRSKYWEDEDLVKELESKLCLPI